MVIDEDLGRSGGGGARPGFDRMLGAVCRGEIGIILAVDATRLARNGMEWHRLIDHCALVGCLLADEQSVYDPRIASDRLMLGVQGAMSELEASNIRRRMMEGKLRKAERGALFSSAPTGYVRIDKERIEKDPDERVRSVLELVFRRFDELQSLRQVMLWLLDEGIELPVRAHGGTTREVSWTRATYSRVRDILENPVYAGAYAFGRSVMRTEVRDGRKHVVQRKLPRPQDWAILIKDTHEGYISWESYERNRQVIADNAQASGREGARGAVRGGAALLAGLLRCGHCGRKLTVTYSGRWNTFRYACANGAVNRGGDKCIAFSGRRVDEAVGGALLRALEPDVERDRDPGSATDRLDLVRDVGVPHCPPHIAFGCRSLDQPCLRALVRHHQRPAGVVGLRDHHGARDHAFALLGVGVGVEVIEPVVEQQLVDVELDVAAGEAHLGGERRAYRLARGPPAGSVDRDALRLDLRAAPHRVVVERLLPASERGTLPQLEERPDLLLLQRLDRLPAIDGERHHPARRPCGPRHGVELALDRLRERRGRREVLEVRRLLHVAATRHHEPFGRIHSHLLSRPGSGVLCLHTAHRYASNLPGRRVQSSSRSSRAS